MSDMKDAVSRAAWIVCPGCTKEWCPGKGRCKKVADYIEERDVAIAQLASYGVSLGEKAELAPVKHGRWEEQDYNWSEAWKCSACGEEWCFEHDPTEPTARVNYCPNCGAKMDLEG